MLGKAVVQTKGGIARLRLGLYKGAQLETDCGTPFLLWTTAFKSIVII